MFDIDKNFFLKICKWFFLENTENPFVLWLYNLISTVDWAWVEANDIDTGSANLQLE